MFQNSLKSPYLKFVEFRYFSGVPEPRNNSLAQKIKILFLLSLEYRYILDYLSIYENKIIYRYTLSFITGISNEVSNV